MLRVEHLDAYYGETRILRGVTCAVARGQVVAILGRNGAGKTTLLRSIMGLTPAHSGEIVFGDRNITRLRTHMIAALGISYVPQGKHIFPRLSVAENLELGMLLQRSDRKQVLADVFEHFPILKERAPQLGGTLSGGEQQMLAIARGLVGEPELMLLDEPSEGIQPNIVQTIKEIIHRTRHDRAVSILLVTTRDDPSDGIGQDR